MFSNPEPTIMNPNYNPLQYEHKSLRYYFEELFNLMDKYQDTKVVVSHLLDKYLVFKNKQFHGRMIESTELATMMKETIKTQGIEQALNLLNNNTCAIDPNDDLLWLLSALYSVFPCFYIKLTNQAILNALTIRDINDIYLHNILKKFIMKGRFIFSYKPEHHAIAHVTGQYESLARNYAKDLTSDDVMLYRVTFNSLNDVLTYATAEQAENIILPAILIFLNPDINHFKEKNTKDVYRRICQVLDNLSCLIDKIRPEAIQNKLLPQLLALYHKKEDEAIRRVFLINPILHCITKMNADALKRDLLPVLVSVYFDPKKTDNEAHIAQKPLIALISKLNRDESDRIAEQITPTIKIYHSYFLQETLKFLKELRLNEGYVNEKLFDVFYKKAHDYNEAFIHALESEEKSQENTLCAQDLTADQVQRILTAKPYQQLPVFIFLSLAPLPKEVYTLEQRKSVFEFLFDKRDQENYLSSLTESLKHYVFSDENERHALIDLFRLACEKIKPEKSNDNGIFHKGYYPLLETCVSHMNEAEIKAHVVPIIKMDKLSDSDYVKNMYETFRILATKTDNAEIILPFYAKFSVAYIRRESREYKDLLDILTKKIPSETFPYLILAFLRNNFEDNRFDNITYVLTLIYNRNKELYGNVPHFCKGREYKSEAAEQKCALM